MKPKHIIGLLITLLFCFNAEAQLFNELKKRAEAKGKKTRKVAYDNSHYEPDVAEEEVTLNSIKDFYNKDVVMTIFIDGKKTQTAYFDADVTALKTDLNTEPHPVFHDEKGRTYGFSEEDNTYVVMEVLPQGFMGFMVAGLLPETYKLPSEPYMQAFQALQSIGAGLNYLTLDLAFVYKLSHFEGDSYYTTSTVPCNTSKKCKRFSHNDPSYAGSYIQFDDQGRLNELYIDIHKHPQNYQGASKILFEYTQCTVSLPAAKEKSMLPGGLDKILLNKGLQPSKN